MANETLTTPEGVVYSLDSETMTATVEGVEKITIEKYTIPDSVTGEDGKQYSVTRIESQAFYYCDNLWQLQLPSTLKEIEMYAFRRTKLKRLTIPDSVTQIGKGILYECTNIQFLALPFVGWEEDSEIPSGLGYLFSPRTQDVLPPPSLTTVTVTKGPVSALAFDQCSNLTTINLNSSITSIGTCAFQDCTGLASIVLPNELTSIGYGAFYGCTSLASIAFPFTNTLAIGDQAFYGCTNLTITAGYIPEKAFQGCDTLVTVNITGSTSIIKAYAFDSCSSLTNIKLTNDIAYIYDYAFQNCVSLESIEFPNNADLWVGKGVFSGCSNLTTVTLSGSSFGKDVLAGCDNITNIILGENLSLTWPNDAHLFNSPKLVRITGKGRNVLAKDCVLYSYGETVKLLRYPRGLSAKQFFIGTNCSIAEGAFANTKVQQIHIYVRGVTLERNSFQNAQWLISVWLHYPAVFEGGVFRNCINLQELYIHEESQINDNSDPELSSITALKTVTCPANFLTYVDWAPNIETLTIIGEKDIPHDAFYHHTGLKEITIRAGVKQLGTAFRECYGLQELAVENPDITIIANSIPFEGVLTWRKLSVPMQIIPYIGYMLNVTNLTITAGDIPSQTFKGLPKLKELIINGATSSIGASAFEQCIELESISITTNKVTSIGDRAFQGCSKAISFSFPGSLTSIENYAFKDCSSVTSFDFPDSLTSIGEHILVNCNAIQNLKAPFIGVSRDEPVRLSEWFMYTDKDNNVIGEYPSSLTDIEITKASKMSDQAFSNFNSLQNIKIDDLEITNLPERLCSGCVSLRSISLPPALTSIGAYAFYRCGSLFSLIIPDSVTTIGNNAFEYCSVDTIIVPESMKNIGEKAFRFARSLEYVTIPKTLEAIESQAFAWCTALKSITFADDEDPSQLKTIGEQAFLDCYNLENISFIGTITQIDSQAFQNCRKLTNVVIPNGASYSTGVFQGCNGITSITLPTIGVTDSEQPHLGEIFGSSKPEAQMNYLPSLLNTVRILQDTYVPDKAFYGCSSLCTIELNEGITNIGEKAPAVRVLKFGGRVIEVRF